MQKTNVSESQQDYLKIVLDLINLKKVARIKEIADRKRVSMPSVTEAMRKLANENLIQYSAHEFVDLTPKGEAAALQLISKHTFLKRFLIEVLNIESDRADQEACELEHHLSGATLDRLILLYQFLSVCQKDDQMILQRFRECIDAAGGKPGVDSTCEACFVANNFPHYPEDNTMHNLLSKLERGQQGQIVMLGPDTEIRRSIIDKGLFPGSTFIVEEVGNKNHPFVVRIDGCAIELDEGSARMIEVAVDQDQ